MFSFLHAMSRTGKRAISVAADSLLITMAYWGAYWVRLEKLTPISSSVHWALLMLLIPVSIFCFIRLGLYRAVLRYVSFKVLWTVALGVFLSTLFFVVSAFYFDVFLPRTVSIIYFAFSMLLIGGVRLFFRVLLNSTRLSRIPAIIYGAGASGRQLQLALIQGNEYYPVAFVDDNPATHDCVMHGCQVYSPSQLSHLVETHQVKKILLAMPSCSPARRLEIIANLEPLECEIQTVPGMADLVHGGASVDQVGDISIEDLLGREPVAPIPELIKANITGKNVMVTGAGGSIGSELCRQIILNKPNRLVLFELSEFALYQINAELSSLIVAKSLQTELVPLLGSVQRKNRVKAVMESFQIQSVYHAAAYKHVPLVESNVVEGVRNNVFGTLFCAEAALEAGVETFVLISSDKAVRPTNTMGVTKRLAELVLQALAEVQERTHFSMVRFGNVLGSSGSVVPLFRQQIREGGPVTVTHPDIIRYFMTIPEAASLVIQAGAMGGVGEVFVLDMGKPVKIMELAQRLIRLSGHTVKSSSNPHGDIEIQITGLRPGEKLYEELLIGANVSGTRHPGIMKANEVKMSWSALTDYLGALDIACHNFEHEKIRQLLLSAPASFEPTDAICDLVWLAKSQRQQQANPAVEGYAPLSLVSSDEFLWKQHPAGLQ